MILGGRAPQPPTVLAPHLGGIVALGFNQPQRWALVRSLLPASAEFEGVGVLDVDDHVT